MLFYDSKSPPENPTECWSDGVLGFPTTPSLHHSMPHTHHSTTPPPQWLLRMKFTIFHDVLELDLAPAQGRSKVRIRVLCAVAAFGRKPPKFHVPQGLAAPEDGGGLPSAATIVLARSGFRQKAAEIPRPSWLGGDFRAALAPGKRARIGLDKFPCARQNRDSRKTIQL